MKKIVSEGFKKMVLGLFIILIIMPFSHASFNVSIDNMILERHKAEFKAIINAEKLSPSSPFNRVPVHEVVKISTKEVSGYLVRVKGEYFLSKTYLIDDTEDFKFGVIDKAYVIEGYEIQPPKMEKLHPGFAAVCIEKRNLSGDDIGIQCFRSMEVTEKKGGLYQNDTTP